MRTSGTLLAETIRREVEISEQLLQEGFCHSVRAGEFLAELKEMIPESSFESWLSKNCNLSKQEAQRLIDFSSGTEITLSVQRAEPGKEHSTRKEKGTEREVLL